MSLHPGGLAEVEKADREKQEKLQMPFLDRKEVQQLTVDKEMISESLVLLRQYSDKTVERLREWSRPKKT